MGRLSLRVLNRVSILSFPSVERRVSEMSRMLAILLKGVGNVFSHLFLGRTSSSLAEWASAHSIEWSVLLAGPFRLPLP